MTSSPQQRILVIDDSIDTHRLVRVQLRALDLEFARAEDGHSGLALALTAAPDLILLDVNMPDLSGFQVCERLKAEPATKDIPVIFLTGADAPDEKARAFELGAQDYVTKPCNAQELRARVASALRAQALVNELERQAHTDRLTGLANREQFQISVRRCLAQRATRPSHAFALLFLDLDRFKIINDSLGHHVGDELLLHVAKTLRTCVDRFHQDMRRGRETMVARLGGDEFTVLLDDVPGLACVEELAETLRRRISEPLLLDGHDVSVGVSIGIRMCDDDADSVDTVLRDSDMAMYRAKAAGKDQCVCFDPEMYAEARERLRIETDLRRALNADDQLHLHYQPIVRLSDGAIGAFEALVRWSHPTLGEIPPLDFISIAEETGLIREVGRWVLETACMQLAEWESQFDQPGPLLMSVNLSKRQFDQRNLIEQVEHALAQSGLQPNQLILEVTESDAMHDPERVVQLLHELRQIGVIIALDDFGTGQSSLASLHELPIDILKVDRAFIERSSRSIAHSAVLQAIVTLAHNLNMSVVAEGIETVDQIAQLQALECDRAQGMLFAPPLPPKALEAFLSGRQDIRSIAA